MEAYNQKDNSMIFNKYLEYSLSVLIMLCLWSCNSSKRISTLIDTATDKDTSQLLFRCDFQKDFKEDTVSLNIDDNIVSRNIILTSVDLSDFTSFALYVVRKANGNVFAIYNGKRNDNGMDFYGKTRIKAVGSRVKLICEINGHQSIKVVDINNGKFVGISKIEKDSIVIRQRKTSFQYD